MMIKYKPNNKEKLMGCLIDDKLFLTNGYWFIRADSMDVNDSGISERIRNKKEFTFEHGELADSAPDLNPILKQDFSAYAPVEDTNLTLRSGSIPTTLFQGEGFYIGVNEAYTKLLSKLPADYFGGGTEKLLLIKSKQNGEILGGVMPMRIELPACIKQGKGE